MPQHASGLIRKPRADDRQLLDVEVGIFGYLAVLVAHDLKLFVILGHKARTLTELCHELKIAPRPAQALLSVCMASGFVQREDGYYALTPLAEDYLLDGSPTYFGGVLDLDTAAPASFEGMKKAILTDTPQMYGGADWVKSHAKQADLATTFTRAMHGYSMGAALAWPEAIDLSSCRLMLDIGGGSAAHCIGATLKWPNLRAIDFDIAPVCQVAQESIMRYGLQRRISTHVGDIWADPFPPADIHFYSMIYHDWPPEKCHTLTQKSFESWDHGGRIVIHELLYNDDKTGPFAVAASNMMMVFATEGQQYSGPEISAMLAPAGFADIKVTPTFGYWSIVTGRKP